MMTLDLVKSVETYRANSEEEAKTFIDEQAHEAQRDGKFEIRKAAYDKKDKKSKGEVVEEWFLVTIAKNFDV